MGRGWMTAMTGNTEVSDEVQYVVETLTKSIRPTLEQSDEIDDGVFLESDARHGDMWIHNAERVDVSKAFETLNKCVELLGHRRGFEVDFEQEYVPYGGEQDGACIKVDSFRVVE